MAAEMSSATWVIGGGGLLGSAVLALASRQGRLVHRSIVPWDDPAESAAVLDADAHRLAAAHGDLSVIWCAGAGVVATGEDALRAELATLRAATDSIRDAHALSGSRIRFFLASSAGGVYAGSADPPFGEHSRPVPLAPYGKAKLEAEGMVQALSENGISVLIGRIANLYGPGQNLDKAQGLVAQLCRAQIERRPLSMYVSLDTARDYVYVDDVANMVLDGLDRLASEREGSAIIKILASHRPTTLGSILGELSRVSKRRPSIVVGAASSSRFQAHDLRFRSTVWPQLDRHASTPLAAGIGATLADISWRLARPAARA